MTENNEKSQTVSIGYIKKRVSAYCDDFKDRFLHFILESIIACVITYLYYNYFRQLSINEIISFNNDISFPFINLKISLTNHHTILTKIRYINKKSKISKGTHNINKTEIDVKSELGLKTLILNDEDDDELTIYFGSNEEFTDDFIEMHNEIYSFNMIENDFKVNKQIRKKKFYVDEELYFSAIKKEPRIFQYYVRSHSIKTLDKTYQFSVIDDNYNIRPFPKVLLPSDSPFLFGITLKKKKFLNSIEVVGDSYYKIFLNLFGTIVAFYEFFIPLLMSCCCRMRLPCCPCNNQMEQNLTQNESSHQKKDLELNNIYNNN